MFEPCQLNKVKQDLICICKQKAFSPVSSINSSQTDKALPVKTSDLRKHHLANVGSF